MRGGEFLIRTSPPDALSSSQIFTPEDFTEEHRSVAKTAARFWKDEVVPALPQIHSKDLDTLKAVVRRSAELGLTAVLVPERFGGMEMDFVSMMAVAVEMGRDGSYAVAHGAQTGIGTLPLLLFGTDEQKERYLERLASAEIFPAYALTEPQAGSDALAARTRADLAADGSHYVLNGQKMWITNGGFADLFTVFAKVDGERFTAFLVERDSPGLSIGAEERKMGLDGSSTTAVFFDNVRVPVGNVIGEIGRGHVAALNVLNVGRLVLGAMALAEAQEALRHSLKFARERKAFGQPIAEFGLIAQKLAGMASRMYASESMLWRVVGEVQARQEGFSEPGAWDRPDAGKVWMKAVEEFATECSLVKVFASEMIDYVVDEGVQIHGGYGYHRDYAIERAYRDARINRVFEGTNEINRLSAVAMMLRRARAGALPLFEAAAEAQAADAPLGQAECARRATLLLLGAAREAFGDAVEREQEVTAAISDAAMYTLAIESATLRSPKAAVAKRKDAGKQASLTAYFAEEAMDRVASTVRRGLASCLTGERLRESLAALHGLTATREPVNMAALGRGIAATL